MRLCPAAFYAAVHPPLCQNILQQSEVWPSLIQQFLCRHAPVSLASDLKMPWNTPVSSLESNSERLKTVKKQCSVSSNVQGQLSIVCASFCNRCDCELGEYSLLFKEKANTYFHLAHKSAQGRGDRRGRRWVSKIPHQVRTFLEWALMMNK